MNRETPVASIFRFEPLSRKPNPMGNSKSHLLAVPTGRYKCFPLMFSPTLTAASLRSQGIGEPPACLPLADAVAARRPSNREIILDAAEAVVLADGAAHLTLDAVAESAKVSKGGLLYHFPNKEALLQAMIDRQVRRIESARLQAMQDLPPQRGRELKACVLMAGDARLHSERRLGCATLAATANNPQALEPIRAAHRRRLDWITEGSRADGLPFERAAIIALAVDGLCLLEILQLSPFDTAQRQRIIADLLQLVDETATAALLTQP